MSYAFVQDVPATWDTYREIAEALGPTAPTGLVLHAAGPTDEGFRMIGVWESREAWTRFHDDRLCAILDGLVAGSRAEPTYRELEVGHLLSSTRESGRPRR
jgi:hypothetical protein